MPGNFLDMKLPTSHFDKIFIYSVLHYLGNKIEVLNFIERALAILKPGGRMLLGDITNVSKKGRFVSSKTGQHVAKDWAELTKNAGIGAFEGLRPDIESVTFDDALVLDLLGIIRSKGMEAFLLPQPIDLPFGGSREDILVVAHD